MIFIKEELFKNISYFCFLSKSPKMLNNKMLTSLKRLLIRSFLLVIISTIYLHSFSQANGKIISKKNNLMVVKVWGTHQERGFAQGYLLGDKITDVFRNYVQPQLSKAYPIAHNLVKTEKQFYYDYKYMIEAKAVILGMNKANTNTLNLDYIDILLANSMLDLSNIMSGQNHTHCSSLMSWGDATKDTDLEGKSIISRHLDWKLSPSLLRNQIMIIHIPSEVDEQPWAGIGFAGMISVLSGFNVNMGVFQHMMEDEKSHASFEKQYEPIWFSLRKSIEMKDNNMDGKNNLLDVYCSLNIWRQGFGGNYIISALGRSTEKEDSLIAMVAELSSSKPYLVYRSNAFEDSIPGDNLYTANYQIARNNAMNFSKRYKGIISHIGDGTAISLEKNRSLMRDYSHLSINYQFMTYCPEKDLFRISIRNKKAAYKNKPMDFKISTLLKNE